ncbi:MAG: transposase [Candidatus Korobacteraceae bacterium]
MSHTYAHTLVHCVFSTKGRLNLIHKPEELWRYAVGLAYAKSIHVVAAGGTANHLHLLILLPQTMTLAKAMQELKANTSRWLRETSSRFQWQEGYGAFSVSQSQRAVVTKYIANQAEHHRTRTFEDEFQSMLQKSGIQYDPRFVFG